MRFEQALPLAAAFIAFLVCCLFNAVYIGVNEARSIEQSDAIAERVAKTILPDLAAGDIDAVREAIDRFDPDRLAVTGPDGERIAGSYSSSVLAKARSYPLTRDTRQLGTLHATRLVPGSSPLPLPMMLALSLLVIGFTYGVSSQFSRVVSRQVRQINESVSLLTQNRQPSREQVPLVFEDFRFLRVAIVRAVRRLRNENRRLATAAYTDERTGLGNSARMTKQLTDFISKSSFEEPSAYILIEADGLQHASEAYSNAMPQEFHAAMARRIAQFVSSQEHQFSMPLGSWPVFALPSDEFAILLNRVGARPEIMKVVRRMLDLLKQPYTVAGQSVRLPASAGIVMLPEDGQTAQEIRKRAESALIQARRTENTDFKFFSPKLDRQNAARKRLEAEVRAAVEAKRFIPVFQPKLDLRTGRIIGAEALARWRLESGRIVSPNVFIPVAEATGLIGEIGLQITRQACRGAAQWHRLGFRDVSIAVNVSPLQFENDDLGSMIINALSEAGLPPRLLQLEITESVAVSDPERLKDVILPLKSMGIKLAIDDFGTGHSNLSMLGRLPFDVFKIDRSFISSLYADKQAPAIVEMILGMAETLGMETVAEGVETEAQANFLRRRGCDQYQGFYYSPPVSLERFVAMLREDGYTAVADVS